MDNLDYDFIIIGSGFGGSVSALRLSEKGYRVLVIEKGREFKNPSDFPKTNWNLRKWLWFPHLKFFGIQQLTFLRHVSILSGVGVGGGSLVYANTLPKPKPQFFNHGPWAKLQNWEELLGPYYDLAWKMLGATQNPYLGDADLTLKELALQIERSESFGPTQVGVYFGEEGQQGVEIPDPYFNGKGPTRTGCINCGACMTGCQHNAKNTLDKNYLYLAKNLGAEILPENKVIGVAPLGNKRGRDGYEVTLKKTTQYFGKKQKIKTKGIIFSAGVLGTLELLLSLQKTTLPLLAPSLGKTIRTNNEALILNITESSQYDFTKGVAIGSILNVDQDSHLETVRYGRGSGFWRILMTPMISETHFLKRISKLILELLLHPMQWMKVFLVRNFSQHASIHLFMQHLDSTLNFTMGPFGLKSQLSEGSAPSAFIQKAHEMAHKYCQIIKGKPMVLFTETLTGIPSTAHILGGACMGATPEEGVIDQDNKVFNYENMYVFDGSMISANPGVNPSLSITAISEFGMSKIPEKGKMD
jgi:cholesterol oxidase